jgi:flagellar motor protein MotB
VAPAEAAAEATIAETPVAELPAAETEVAELPVAELPAVQTTTNPEAESPAIITTNTASATTGTTTTALAEIAAATTTLPPAEAPVPEAVPVQETATAPDIAAAPAAVPIPETATVPEAEPAAAAVSQPALVEEKSAAEAALTAAAETTDAAEAANAAEAVNAEALAARDKAVAAKTAALDTLADLNTPDEIAAADGALNDGLAALEARDSGRAITAFTEAAAAYDASRESTIAAHADSESAISAAREALRLATAVAEKPETAEAAEAAEDAGDAEFGENIYIKEAQGYLNAALALHEEARFADSAINAREVLNYLSMSEAFIANERTRMEREAVERLAAEKSAADLAIAAMKSRLEWADRVNLASDYPAQAARAATLLRSSDIAYENEAYAAAKALAEEASNLLSDEFKAVVLADRKAAEAGKATLSELAADRGPAKAIVERLQVDARARLAWAELDGIREEYPAEFSEASVAMTASFVAYGAESYGQAAESARRVGVILSDEFRGKVAARREAARAEAARLAAEKVEAERRAAEAARLAAERKVAETALADAKARMAWAESADLRADYPVDYAAGSRDYSTAETAFSGERYQLAAALAAEVSARFSDAFMASVAADRKSRRELAAKKAAEKAAAEAAIADARVRMAWAGENAIAAEYPKEFAAASAAMEGSIAFYGKEAYPGSEREAKTVSSTLSDAFMAKVAADRKVAALRASDTLAPPALKVAVSPSPFSPDGDGVDDTLTISLGAASAAGIAEWKLEIFETSVVESSKAGAAGQDRLFASWSGKGQPPASIAWDGKSSRKELVESATDYKYRFAATTTKGKAATASGTVSVDVLVIKEGDRLKLKVPSIVFRANNADFVGLENDVVENNARVIARIAEILNKFPGYDIKIQGNANSASKIGKLSAAAIAAEETKELLPLSKARAEYVRVFLVQNGVDPKRLSVEGLGSSEPVVSFQDAQNRWKNRRVEFVLIKQR